MEHRDLPQLRGQRGATTALAGSPGGKLKKMTKEEKQKARDLERVKKRQPTAPAETSQPPKP